jgi:hypothetical protein
MPNEKSVVPMHVDVDNCQRGRREGLCCVGCGRWWWVCAIRCVGAPQGWRVDTSGLVSGRDPILEKRRYRAGRRSNFAGIGCGTKLRTAANLRALRGCREKRFLNFVADSSPQLRPLIVFLVGQGPRFAISTVFRAVLASGVRVAHNLPADRFTLDAGAALAFIETST